MTTDWGSMLHADQAVPHAPLLTAFEYLYIHLYNPTLQNSRTAVHDYDLLIKISSINKAFSVRTHGADHYKDERWGEEREWQTD